MKANSIRLVLLITSFLTFTGCGPGKLKVSGDLTDTNAFWAKDSVEAFLTFAGKVQVKMRRAPSDAEALDQVEQQVRFMIGHFNNTSPHSAPKRNHQIKLTTETKLGEDLYEIRYIYEGYLQTQVMDDTMEIILPINPDEIHAQSGASYSPRAKEPCGDKNHPGADYFWYFMNINLRGCPLEVGTHLYEFTGSLKHLDSTTLTFPDYDRLAQDKKIEVHVFFGIDTEAEKNPLKSKDLNAINYRQVRDYLLASFSSRVWTQDEIDAYLGKTLPADSFVEEFSLKSGKTPMTIRMWYGDTDTGSGELFHHFYSRSLKEAAVIIYAGHSGLGEYLAPETIAGSGLTTDMPKDRYQILFFNGCNSYPYYNLEYFAKKITSDDPFGTKNLDIITNGLATYFHEIPNSNISLIKAIEDFAKTKKKTSYQEIVERADSENLIAINGDEDNPKTRVR